VAEIELERAAAAKARGELELAERLAAQAELDARLAWSMSDSRALRDDALSSCAAPGRSVPARILRREGDMPPEEAPLVVTEADFANLSLLEPSAALARRLESATVVLSDQMPPERVTMNSQFVLRDEKTGERRVLRIVYPDDADPDAGSISVLEPLGTRLLGMAAQQAIDWQLADGAHRLRVEQVLYQPEHSLRTNLVLRR